MILYINIQTKTFGLRINSLVELEKIVDEKKYKLLTYQDKFTKGIIKKLYDNLCKHN